jgi:hypothetical protein
VQDVGLVSFSKSNYLCCMNACLTPKALSASWYLTGYQLDGATLVAHFTCAPMNKLLLVLLVWLSSCATFVPYATTEPRTYYAVGATWAFKNPGELAAYNVAPGQRVLVIGTYGNWFVVRRGGDRLLVPDNALVPDMGGELLYTDTPIYPVGYRAAGSGPDYYAPVPEGVTHDVYTGPRGGHYYYNGNGNKTYVTPQSTIDNNLIQTGPRGGQYYLNSHGNKTYIKH